MNAIESATGKFRTRSVSRLILFADAAGRRASPVASTLVLVLTTLVPALPTRAAESASGPFSVTVRAGGLDERCLRLEAGEGVDYEFTADHAVDFNIHYHRGRDVHYPVRLTAVRSTATTRFVAAARDDYCLMWENHSASAVKIDARIARSR